MMGLNGSKNSLFQDPASSRLARKPTHAKGQVVSEEELIIGYEIFRFRGGAPPHRGWHYDDDDTLRVPRYISWEELCQRLKDKHDSGDTHDLSYEIYPHGSRSDDNSISIFARGQGVNPSSLTVYQAFVENNMHLRLYMPFGRGMVDIGTFVKVTTEESISEGKRPSLLGKTTFNRDEILQLKSAFKSRDQNSSEEITEKSPSFQTHQLSSSDVKNRLTILKNLADEKYAQQHHEAEEKGIMEEKEKHKETDLQIPLTRDQLESLIGEEIVKELEGLFGERASDIVLRRSNLIDHCIDFHTDYAFKTLQVSLIDDEDYDGGRLVFVVGDELVIPKRSIGTVTLHDNEIIHGVTRLRAGVRYGLLILDRPKGTQA